MYEFQPTIAAMHAGLPQTYRDEGARDNRPAEWRSAFFKSPVHGPIPVGEEGLAGDGVADRKNHGGIDGAVLAYAASHYERWAEELPDKSMLFGGFGENLTVDGLTEDNVCIGDRWRVGDALLEISKPRQPCWKLCRRWNQPDLAKRVVQAGRGGWYFRVIAPGVLSVGDVMTLEAQPHPEWTVMRVQRLFYGIDRDPAAARELASLPELSLGWREELLSRRA
ncbi:MAG: MOSC domain-containing protein [Planctomycetaceae bacterium]